METTADYEIIDERTLKDKQSEIYHHYGIDTQLEKLEEECIELVLAIKQRKKLKGERTLML